MMSTEQNRCNARVQVSDVMLTRFCCGKYLCRHILVNHIRELQTSNCKRVPTGLGKSVKSKR